MSESFRPIRRKDRMLDNAEVLALLEKGQYGILSINHPEGWPCAVPLSYVVIDGDICFHCAGQGEKLDRLAEDDRVTFCVVGRVEATYAASFTTLYESVVVHGTAKAVEDPAGKRDILMALTSKYLPGHIQNAPEDITRSMGNVNVFRITPVHCTGKANR